MKFLCRQAAAGQSAGAPALPSGDDATNQIKQAAPIPKKASHRQTASAQRFVR
jgi:hypothetical protein